MVATEAMAVDGEAMEAMEATEAMADTEDTADDSVVMEALVDTEALAASDFMDKQLQAAFTAVQLSSSKLFNPP